MATVNFQETDSAATCTEATTNTICTVSGASAASRLAQQGGTAGSSEITVSVAAGGISYLAFDLPMTASWTGSAGNWTPRINVTTAASDIDWDILRICERNSGCTLQSSIFNTGADLNLNCGATGTLSTTQSGAAFTINAGDRVTVTIGFRNANTMKSISVGITPSLLIDSPVDDGGAPSTFLKDVIGGLGVIPWKR